MTPTPVSADSGFLSGLAQGAPPELADALRHVAPTPAAAYDAWIFDFDGTLADTDELARTTAQSIMDTFGIGVDDSWLRTVPLGAVRMSHG
ncbi:hypothetical protein ACWD5V_40910 [Streptomyces sp. NPDC002523]